MEVKSVHPSVRRRMSPRISHPGVRPANAGDKNAAYNGRVVTRRQGWSLCRAAAAHEVVAGRGCWVFILFGWFVGTIFQVFVHRHTTCYALPPIWTDLSVVPSQFSSVSSSYPSVRPDSRSASDPPQRGWTSIFGLSLLAESDRASEER